MRNMTCLVLAALAALASLKSTLWANDDPPAKSTVEMLVEEAEALQPLVESALAKLFLRAASDLPSIEERTVHHHRSKRLAMTEAEAEAAGGPGSEAVEGYQPVLVSERFYYMTRYGSPLAYVRAIDIAAYHGVTTVNGSRVFDFGFGGIGHMRLLASLGATAVGVEVDDLLRAAYDAPGDTGEIPRAKAVGEGPVGGIDLVFGSWPGDEAVRNRVGGGFHLVLSKNVLKRGYIHPEREVDPRMLVHLGVDDAEYLKRLYDAMAPGGLVVAYNISPAPSKTDEPYKPWADGRFPFERKLVRAAGFEIVAFDEDDTRFVKRMAKAMGWDAAMDIENDLFASYTVLRRPV